MSTAEDRPAIAGGTPAKTVPYGKQNRYGAEELEQLREALEQGTLFYTQGRKVRELEAAFAERIGSRFAVATSSGTASIHAAMIAAGVSPGDEVIVSPITDMGSIIPILFQGAVPVFADVDPRTYNMEPASVEANMTDRTRAVLAVHLAGNPCDLDAMKASCDARGIALIEDCAQAWGALWHGQWVGTIGSIGCYSLNEFKHISCGDGGLVATDDPALAKRLRLATDKCYDRDAGAAVRQATFLATNYRMNELQGAVALAQLLRLSGIVERRQAYWNGLHSALLGLSGLLLPKVTPGGVHSAWFYMLRVDEDALGTDVNTFTKALQAEGLPASAHYIGDPIYTYPLFTGHTAFAHAPHPFAARCYERGLCPVAETVLDTCVMLSVSEYYTERDLEETILGVRRVARWYAEKT